MPIATLSVFVRHAAEKVPPQTVSAIADGLGKLFESGAGGTWVLVDYVSMDDYAESGGPVDMDLRPVWVDILHSKLPDAAGLDRQASDIATLVSKALGRRPENTHVFFSPEGRGRVAFGGKLRR